MAEKSHSMRDKGSNTKSGGNVSLSGKIGAPSWASLKGNIDREEAPCLQSFETCGTEIRSLGK